MKKFVGVFLVLLAYPLSQAQDFDNTFKLLKVLADRNYTQAGQLLTDLKLEQPGAKIEPQFEFFLLGIATGDASSNEELLGIPQNKFSEFLEFQKKVVQFFKNRGVPKAVTEALLLNADVPIEKTLELPRHDLIADLNMIELVDLSILDSSGRHKLNSLKIAISRHLLNCSAIF